MRIIRDGKADGVKKAIALGNFDGLHRAHTKIVKTCCQYAEENGLESSVLLFLEHTVNVITGKKVKLITDEAEKLEILDAMGVDCVYIREFDADFMHLSPEEFICGLIDKLNITAVCVGYDYRFGYKAEGDVSVLKKLGEKHGFEVIVTDEMKTGGVTIKSTKIRELVCEGKVDDASLFLGRPFSITGEVTKGLRNGHKLGTPTANVGYGDNKILPKEGVYMGYTTVCGVRYDSVINVGSNPTFDAKKITVESHIIGFSGDIYGKTVKVDFVKRIRGDIKFDSLDGLKAQIKSDIQTAKEQLHRGEKK